MNRPQVSVICLCYNHRAFMREAMESVLSQTYANVQVIVVDDASTDGSKALILEFSRHHSQIQTLLLSDNVGNCKAFNQGLRLATGDYVIDFSTDDVMIPDRIQKQVDFFEKQREQVGVVFTDAVYINENGKPFRNHYDYLFRKKLIARVPHGDVFRAVLTTYFICSPTMMVKKNVMDVLEGYDEKLAYEDFDFWVRASQKFEFAFLDEKTTMVRKSPGSLSMGWYEKGDLQLHSTFLVCEKAEKLCRNESDRRALRWRVGYEFRQAVFSRNKAESKLFAGLRKRLGKTPVSFFVIQWASYVPLPWARMRKLYHRLRYR
jgi:glycosyltransferase involved in cell wall biosynthesis